VKALESLVIRLELVIRIVLVNSQVLPTQLAQAVPVLPKSRVNLLVMSAASHVLIRVTVLLSVIRLEQASLVLAPVKLATCVAMLTTKVWVFSYRQSSPCWKP
jgi:hypothetical protein